MYAEKTSRAELRWDCSPQRKERELNPVRNSRTGCTETTAMSTIEEVRAAEKRVQEILEVLREVGSVDPDNFSEELRKATDEYARAVRELRVSNT